MIAPVDRSAEFFADLCSQHVDTSKSENDLVVFAKDTVMHPFQEFAAQISAKITEMRDFILRKRRSYADFSERGMRDEERDEIDSAIAQFLQCCMERIETLKNESIAYLERRGRNMSFAAHKLGVTVILSGQLQTVSELSEELRGLRIRQAIEEKSKPTVKYDPKVVRQVTQERRASLEMNGGEGITGQAEFAMYEQEFAQENVSLRTELIETRESVRQVEKTVAEIANLNHVFATKVLEQAKEIEVLYDLAVESTLFVERGNRELRKLRDKGPNVIKLLTVIMFAMSAFMFLMFLWYN